MKPIDREVRAPISIPSPFHLGTLTVVQSGEVGSTRLSWRDPGTSAGWLVSLAAVAGIAGLFGAPMVLAQNLGTVALGSSSSAIAVTVNLPAGGTLNTISVSTQGISSLDFADSGGGSCTVSNVYTSGQSCTVIATFSPTAPGLRLGAVELFDSSGDLLGTGYMYGTGTGSLLRYNPGTQAVLYSGLNAPQAMVVDAGSNIYIADTSNARVLKLPWNGSSYGTPVTVGAGWSAPSGVAVDGAGNLYVADAGLNEVVEIPWTGSAYGTQVAIGGTYTYAQDLTIDGSGNLYILTSAATITKLPWNGTGYDASSTIGSGFSGGQYNTDVVDSSGNIYVADYNNGNVVKETPSGPSYNQTILGNFGASSVDGIATDPAGNVYLANYGAGTVLMLPWTGSGYGASITLTSNGLLSGPEAIYLDGIGNIYIEDYNNNLVEKWSVTDLPTLTFSTHTDVGSPDTTDNPQTVSLLNVGNAALTILVPGAGNNPSISSGFSYDSSSTCPQLGTSSGAATVASASSCTYAVNFIPTEAGTNSGALVLTDNYLGASSTTQSIALTGTGISLVTKLAFDTAPVSPIALGGNAGGAITVDEEKSSSAIDSAANDLITLTVTGPSSYLQSYTATAVDGVATFTLSGAALSTPGSYSYTASLASVTSAIASETVSSTTPQTITFSAASPVNYGVAPITLTATGGASGNAVTFSILSGGSFGSLSGNNDSTLTITGAGTITIAANQAGDSDYAAATQATASIVITTVAQTIAFTPSSPVTYGISPITLNATGGASGNAVTFSILSGGGLGSLSGTNNSTLTVIGSGTITIAANQAGNGNYSAAAQVTASIVVTNLSQTITFSPSTPVTYGVAPITLNATGGASGNAVIFGYVSGPGTLGGSNGNTLTVTGAGTVVVTANQAGGTGYSAATAVTASIVVSKASQTIAFTPSSPVTDGVAPITLSATGGASGNVVTFGILSGGSFGSLSGTNGSTLTVIGAGTIVIAANQVGNANYAAATQVTASIVVTTVTQTIAFTPSTPVTYGVAPITLSATGGGSGTAVTFSILSGGSFGSLSGTNGSTLTITGAGTVTVAANQAGNADYSAAAQVTASIAITRAALSVLVNPASSVYGAVFPTFSGSLTGALSGDGITASYSTTATPASPAGGSYSITATLVDPNSKIDNYSVTNTPAALSISKAASVVQVSSSVNPVLLSDPTALTATVSSGAGQPTGSVIFLDNATAIGSASLSNGVATLSVSTLTVGSHLLSAVYSSDTNFSASTSGALTQSVIDFTATPGGSGGGGASGSSQTVTPGSAATFSLAIVPTNGTTLPTPTVMTITGMPPGATAAVSPSSWAQTSGASWTFPANTPLTNVVLTIGLPSASARMDGKVPLGRGLPPLLWGLLLVPFAGRLRRKRSPMSQTISVLLLLAVGGAAIAGVSGCNSTNGFFNQRQQTYTMNVTVASGALSHSATITLTVE